MNPSNLALRDARGLVKAKRGASSRLRVREPSAPAIILFKISLVFSHKNGYIFFDKNETILEQIRKRFSTYLLSFY